MNKFVLSILLLSTPFMITPINKQKTKKIKRIKKKVEHTLPIQEEEQETVAVTEREALCGPQTIRTIVTVSGTVFVATIQVVAAILAIVL